MRLLCSVVCPAAGSLCRISCNLRVRAAYSLGHTVAVVAASGGLLVSLLRSDSTAHVRDKPRAHLSRPRRAFAGVAVVGLLLHPVIQ